MDELWKPYPMFCPNCGKINYSKVKASDLSNSYNRAFSSRSAVFDKPIDRSEGTACEARRTSPHSFKLRRVCGRMCRATD